MKKIIFLPLLAAAAIIFTAAFCTSSCKKPAQEPVQLAKAVEEASGKEFSYDGFVSTLSAYVDNDGMVNYSALKGGRSDLDAFAGALAALKPDVYNQWNEKQKIAFWTNAYNALTLEAIINNYPIKSSVAASIIYPKNSIRQIPGVWDKMEWTVMGEKITLDAIEHEKLRAGFNEPRIHVALVCAAVGCPPLRKEPYTGEKLDAQFDDQAVIFLANPQKFAIDRQKSVVRLSPIFKWFGEDFIETYGISDKFQGHGESERAVLNFISKYLGDNDRAYIETQRYDIDFASYDWTLNEKK